MGVSLFWPMGVNLRGFSKVASLIGKGFAPATHKRYETSLRHTQAFLKFQFGVTDINIEKVDNAFITDYDYYWLFIISDYFTRNFILCY